MAVAIICELNPLHRGHKYLFDCVHRQAPDAPLIAVMSGNFVQRGDAAVFDKYTRAKTAVENGADLVMELPTPFATLSAAGFAKSGTDIIKATGIADTIAFGAETPDEKQLKKTAERLNDPAVQEQIKAAMKSGVTYARAVQTVTGSCILETPNNVLAVEYLRHCGGMNVLPVGRIGGGHDSGDEQYSAGAVRHKMAQKNEDFAALSRCERAVLCKLRTMQTHDFLQIPDVTEGLEHRFAACVKSARTLDELIDSVKSKRYTHARLRRIVLRAFLGITHEDIKEVPYLHILAFNERGRQALHEMGRRACLPIITKHRDTLELPENARRLYEKECVWTDLHAMMYKTPRPCGREQTSSVIKVTAKWNKTAEIWP